MSDAPPKPIECPRCGKNNPVSLIADDFWICDICFSKDEARINHYINVLAYHRYRKRTKEQELGELALNIFRQIRKLIDKCNEP